MMYHNPVLESESLDGLALREGGVYVDLTFGGGGHSRALLNSLKNCRLIAIDTDGEADKNIIDDERFTLALGNFRYVTNILRYLKAIPVDGILADLGVSSHQFDSANRGFSFRSDSILDMRMDSRSHRTALDIVNNYSIEELTALFVNYGEVPMAKRIATKIVNKRESKQITTTGELVKLVSEFTQKSQENKSLAKVFQAFRIEVNEEIESLKEMLMQVPSLLKPKGRLVVISYHSLEDRLVKHFLRSGNFEDRQQTDFYGNITAPLKMVNRKAITPSEEELLANNRARSAKLRIGERIEHENI